MTKIKYLLSTLTAAACVAGAGAQGRVWSLDECMAYAAEHGSSVAQARWDLVGAKAEYANAVANFLPSVSAQTAAQFSWGRNIDPETNTYNNVTTFNNGYGLYASLTLFDGGQTYNNWRLARAERERSRNAIDMRRDDAAIAAMMAYADAAYYLGAIAIAEDKAAQSEALLALTLRQEELGMMGAPDVAQARASHSDDLYTLTHQQNVYRQSMLTLRSALNLPDSMALAVDTTWLETEYLTYDLPVSIGDICSYAMANNPLAIEAEKSVESARYRYRSAQGALWPTISVSGGISTSFYRMMGSEVTFPRFGEQFRNNRGEYVQVNFSLPLFDNLWRSSSARRAKANWEIAKSQRDESLRKLRDDITLAVLDRDGYAAEIVALTDKLEADYTAYRLNLRKYEEGLLSLIDLQLSANTYYASRLALLQKQTLYMLKDKLVNYYKGEPLWTLK